MKSQAHGGRRMLVYPSKEKFLETVGKLELVDRIIIFEYLWGETEVAKGGKWLIALVAFGVGLIVGRFL